MYILSVLHQLERQYVVSGMSKSNKLTDIFVVMFVSGECLYPSILKAKNNGVPNTANDTKKTGDIYFNNRLVQENRIDRFLWDIGRVTAKYRSKLRTTVI